MDKRVFVIEMPALEDDAVARIQEFLWDLVNSFEAQYYQQLYRYYRHSLWDDDQDPR